MTFTSVQNSPPQLNHSKVSAERVLNLVMQAKRVKGLVALIARLLLQEYFYSDWERLQAVVSDRFVKLVPTDNKTRIALGDFYDSDGQYEITPYTYTSDSTCLDALRHIYS